MLIVEGALQHDELSFSQNQKSAVISIMTSQPSTTRVLELVLLLWWSCYSKVRSLWFGELL